MDNKRKDKRRKSEFVLNYKSREADHVEVKSKVERKIQFFPAVQVKLFKNDEDRPEKTSKVKFVKLKS